MTWRRRIEPFTRPLFFASARLLRGMTLGVRGLATDGDGRVLLVEHTYVPGWYLPGGGVERGETPEQALVREMWEEAGVELVDRPTLVSVHDNGAYFPGDHVLVFRCGTWRPVASSARGEIKSVGWIASDDLPADTTPATRARLSELLHGVAPDPTW